LYKAVYNIKNQFGSNAISKAVTSGLTDGKNQNTTRHNKKKEAE
jgi:hypothetical protein